MKRLETIDGETLMSQPLQPLSFVVDTLISQGLHILAGSPKQSARPTLSDAAHVSGRAPCPLF